MLDSDHLSDLRLVLVAAVSARVIAHDYDVPPGIWRSPDGRYESVPTAVSVTSTDRGRRCGIERNGHEQEIGQGRVGMEDPNAPADTTQFRPSNGVGFELEPTEHIPFEPLGRFVREPSAGRQPKQQKPLRRGVVPVRS